MNKMTLTHIGIFLAGAAIGYLVAKSNKKDSTFANYANYANSDGVPHYTQDGKLWNGPVHKDQSGRLMTGSVHTSDSQYLYHHS